MSPYAIIALYALGVGIATTIIVAFIDRRRHRSVKLDPDLQRALRGYRDGGVIVPGQSVKTVASAPAVPPNLERPRTRPAFGKRKPSMFLTARQLGHVNLLRKAQGRRPLNRTGFTAAVATASTMPRQPDNTTDWLTYLILYECLTDGHTTNRVEPDTGISITPEAPFNGHGGEFAGAGASGDWQNPDARTASVAAVSALYPANAAFGAGRFDDSGGPATAPSDYGSKSSGGDSYTASDPSPSYSAPDPSPSYSAPDPSPSIDTSGMTNV